MSLLDDVLTDLSAEGDSLVALVADLAEDQWHAATPAEGWDVATTIGHLAWTDRVALKAAHSCSAQGKVVWDEVVLQALADPDGFVDVMALAAAQTPRDELIQEWQHARIALAHTLGLYPAGRKIPWFGPPMSPTSMATARFMETWAHGIDVRTALGRTPERTDRIRHVAHLGVRTRGYAFANNSLDLPAAEVFVDLTSPSGEAWTWGDPAAPERITGSAWDFCLLGTQRIHREDTDLLADGAGAEQWLRIAQTFAGPAGGGRTRQGAQ